MKGYLSAAMAVTTLLMSVSAMMRSTRRFYGVFARRVPRGVSVSNSRRDGREDRLVIGGNALG